MKPTLALKPEKRAKWLTQAIIALKDGGVRVSDVYDIVSHPKFINGVSNGHGQKMRHQMSKELRLFTDKQRQGLEKSELFKKFNADDGPKAAKPSKPEVDEGKMDDMMARCRAFVRDNETLWEDRKRELDEAEAERERREEEERLKKEEEERRQKEEEEERQREEAAHRAEEEAEKLAAEERRASGEDQECDRSEAAGSPERRDAESTRRDAIESARDAIESARSAETMRSRDEEDQSTRIADGPQERGSDKPREVDPPGSRSRDHDRGHGRDRGRSRDSRSRSRAGRRDDRSSRRRSSWDDGRRDERRSGRSRSRRSRSGRRR